MREQHHPSSTELDLSSVLHALSDPARLAVVRHLAAEGECRCGHFELGISKATLSHHFRVLREAGVLHSRPDGRKRYLSLRSDDLEARFPGLLEAVLSSETAGQNGREAAKSGPGDAQGTGDKLVGRP